MGEKNIWERIKDSSNCRVLILNLILTLCLNLLLEFTERLKAAGYVNEAAETKRFTDLTDELFKRVSELFKDTELPLEEFFSLIDACFISMKGSMIPETMDMVIAGDL